MTFRNIIYDIGTKEHIPDIQEKDIKEDRKECITHWEE